MPPRSPSASGRFAREAALSSAAAHRAGGSANGDPALAEREEALDARARQLDARLAQLEERERAVDERERVPQDPDAARLAEIDARLDELRAAEEAFLRTRRELADHSDAIAACTGQPGTSTSAACRAEPAPARFAMPGRPPS